MLAVDLPPAISGVARYNPPSCNSQLQHADLALRMLHATRLSSCKPVSCGAGTALQERHWLAEASMRLALGDGMCCTPGAVLAWGPRGRSVGVLSRLECTF